MLSYELFSDRWDKLILLFNTLVVAVVCYLCLTKALALKTEKMEVFVFQNCERDKGISDRKYFLLTALFIFLLWLPVFLAYYPGLFAYDVENQINQKVIGYSTKHPLLHTLYLQFFYYFIGHDLLKSYNKGIAVATLIQMGVFALMLSFSHLYLRKVNIRKKWRIILIGATGILPFFSMLAIAMTKDTFFTGCFAMLVTILCYQKSFPEFIERHKLYRILYILSIAGTILFRNTGVYPVIALAISFLVITVRCKKQTRIFFDTVLALILGIATFFVLQFGTQAISGFKGEMLSIPYQQLACSYSDHQQEMEEEEIQSIKNIIPDVDNYTTYKVGTIVGTTTGLENFPYFLSTYFRIGLRYPMSYIKGFFYLNAGYLGITDTTFAEIYGTDNRQGIFLSDTKPGFDITHKSLFPPLESLYEKLYTENDYQYVLGLNILCSPALYFWLICFIFMYSVIYRIRGMGPIFVFMFVFILTVIAGPCALVRYALPYMVCTPALFAAILWKKIKEIPPKVNGKTEL